MQGPATEGLRMQQVPDARRIMAACMGDCVHVAGVLKFLETAKAEGFDTRFLGTAQNVGAIIQQALSWQPDVLALSYRLNTGSLENLLRDLRHRLEESGLTGLRMVFGGTDPNCRIAIESGLFDAGFGSGATAFSVRRYLRGESLADEEEMLPGTLVERIEAKSPFPLIRHHFGRPTVRETVAGSRQIATAKALDVLSIGPDQNAQAKFFRPQEMDHAQDGAGGVPLRSERDLELIYEATRAGNYPLVRCYSGTQDVIRFADVLSRTIKNAWGAIPLYWYNELDGRSSRRLRHSIKEAQEAIRWHAQRGTPVEVNESHQWSLRSAPDTVAVATFFLAAYNARQAGVKNYIGQFMFDTPHGTTPAMDLAKMQAKLEITRDLQGPEFRVIRQTRTGLSSMPADERRATGHLCASIANQMALKPHIVHVVSFSEASHAATADDLIAATQIAAGAVGSLLHGMPDPSSDPVVRERKEELIHDTRLLLQAIQDLAPPDVLDPFTDPETLARAVECGLLDAPDLAGNTCARGAVRISLQDGACRAISDGGRYIPESMRISACLSRLNTRTNG